MQGMNWYDTNRNVEIEMNKFLFKLPNIAFY